MSHELGRYRPTVQILLGVCFSGAMLVGCATRSRAPEVLDKDGPFVLLSTGVFVDTSRGLMWSVDDNEGDISFDDASIYIDTFERAGYDDWRFPTIQELETLLVEGARNQAPPGPGCIGEYDAHRFVVLSCCCPWALQDNGTRPASFPFVPGMAQGTMWHHNSGRSGNRALPVRDLESDWVAPVNQN